MKQRFISIHAAATADGNLNLAAALAKIYLREYGKPMPSPEVAAVAEYLNSKPPFPVAATTNDHLPK